MSENLFTNAQKELERLECLMQARLKRYCLTLNKDKVPPVNGKPSREVYSASITFTKLDGSSGYMIIDSGESFPDLFSKISDKL